MFLYYEYKSYIDYDQIMKQYSCRYKIIDSNFEAEAVGAEIEICIIQEYSKRNLNVAANLIRVFKYRTKKCGAPLIERSNGTKNIIQSFINTKKILKNICA